MVSRCCNNGNQGAMSDVGSARHVLHEAIACKLMTISKNVTAENRTYLVRYSTSALSPTFGECSQLKYLSTFTCIIRSRACPDTLLEIEISDSYG